MLRFNCAVDAIPALKCNLKSLLFLAGFKVRGLPCPRPRAILLRRKDGIMGVLSIVVKAITDSFARVFLSRSRRREKLHEYDRERLLEARDAAGWINEQLQDSREFGLDYSRVEERIEELRDLQGHLAHLAFVQNALVLFRRSAVYVLALIEQSADRDKRYEAERWLGLDFADLLLELGKELSGVPTFAPGQVNTGRTIRPSSAVAQFVVWCAISGVFLGLCLAHFGQVGQHVEGIEERVVARSLNFTPAGSTKPIDIFGEIDTALSNIDERIAQLNLKNDSTNRLAGWGYAIAAAAASISAVLSLMPLATPSKPLE